MTAETPPDRINDLMHELWMIDRSVAKHLEQTFVDFLRIAIRVLEKKNDRLQAKIR